MTDTQVTNNNNSGTDRALTGQSNWIRWFPGFKADARADDTWMLFAGTEAILPKPLRKDYLSRSATTNAAPSAAGDDTASVTSSASTITPPPAVDPKATGPEVARQDFMYKQNLDLYKMDLHDFEHQHERVRRANKMLHDRIHPSMQAEIDDLQVPSEALQHLQRQYKMQDSRAIQLAHDRIDQLSLTQSKDMAEYINTMRQYKNDLHYLGDPITDSRYITKLIRGLPPAYSSWVERYHDIAADPDAPVPSLKSVEAQLISKEATLPKPGPTSGSGSTSAKRNNRTRDNKDRDPSRWADGTIKDKCTYEPCGKWGHKEENCFIKDPSKKKPRSTTPPNKPTTETTSKVTTTTTKPGGFSAVAIIDADDFEQQLQSASAGWITVGQQTQPPRRAARAGLPGPISHRNQFEIISDHHDMDASSSTIPNRESHQTPQNPQFPADAPPPQSEWKEQSKGEHGFSAGDNGHECVTGSCAFGADNDVNINEMIAELNDATILAAMVEKDVTRPRDTWLYDSGCNAYICNDASWFTILHPLNLQVSTETTLQHFKSKAEELWYYNSLMAMEMLSLLRSTKSRLLLVHELI
jgi:hypothetical protein